MISAVMIVKNEESCLEKCLESIKGLDEIIICDTGSEDKTIEIAKKYTDKVFTDYKWNDSMCEARNHALSKATGDWVLSIDADETLEDGGVEKIRKAVEKATNRLIQVKMKSARGIEEFYFPRVFKRDKEVFWKGAIHNYLSVADVEYSDITIFYSYSEAHSKDPNRAFRILSKEVMNDPTLIREKFYLAREYWYKKDYKTAIKWYKDYLETAYWIPEMAEASLQIAKCYWNLKDYKSATNYCMKCLLLNADFKEALIMMSKLSPKNTEHWIKYANISTNKDVLFVR